MKRAFKLCFVLLLTVSTTTGCWDLREPDQIAFVMGSGLDLTKDGQLESSLLIAVPSGIGGGQDGGGGGGDTKKSFHVLSSSGGKNVYDAAQKIQTKLSRSLFFGHRQTILIGQRLAEQGIGNYLDVFIRYPQSELRSTIMVVKDGQASELYTEEPIFDPFVSIGLVRVQETLGLKPYYFRHFLSDAWSQGAHPLVPAVSRDALLKKFVYSGSAVINKDDGLKLAGFLNMEESFHVYWMRGRLTGYTVTSFVTNGRGYITLKMQTLGNHIRVKMVDKQLQIDVRLTGKGTIIENDTNLDPSKPRDLQIIQDELSQTTQKSIQQLIEKVQKQYKTDIFGFGESVHQQYPNQWKTLKQHWNDTFPQLHVSVKVDLECNDQGRAKSSMNVMP